MRSIITVLQIVLLALLPLTAKPDKIDSLKKELSATKTDINKHKLLVEIAKSYGDTNYTKALDYFKQSLDVVERTKHKQLIGNSYHFIGYTYMKQGELNFALDNFNNALAIFEFITDEKSAAGVLNDIGLIYKNKGKYDIALEKFTKALIYYEKLKDVEGISIASNNIGQVQYFKGDYQSAIEYFVQYYDVNKVLKKPHAVAGAANNIASAYLEINNYNKAIEYYFIALGIYDSLNIKIGKAIIQDNLGSLFYEVKQYNDALLYHKQALSILEELKSPTRIGPTKINIAKVQLKINEVNEAIVTLNEALDIVEPLGLNEQVRNIYKMLSEAYNQTHCFEQAYSYLKKFQNLNDSISNVETFQNIEKIKNEYETEKRNKEIAIAIKQADIQRAATIAISGVLVILIILLTTTYIQNKKQKTAINKHNRFRDEVIKITPILINTSPEQLACSNKGQFTDSWRIMPGNRSYPKIYFNCIDTAHFMFTYLLHINSCNACAELINITINNLLVSSNNTNCDPQAIIKSIHDHIGSSPLTQEISPSDYTILPFIIKKDMMLNLSHPHLLVYQENNLISPENNNWVKLEQGTCIYFHSTQDYDEAKENNKDFLKLFYTLGQYEFKEQKEIVLNTLKTIDSDKISLIYALRV